MEKEPEERRGGSFLLPVAGAYLVYLGGQQLYLLYRHEVSYPILSIVSGLAFLTIGGIILYREWKAYRRTQQNGNADPAMQEDEEEDGES